MYLHLLTHKESDDFVSIFFCRSLNPKNTLLSSFIWHMMLMLMLLARHLTVAGSSASDPDIVIGQATNPYYIDGGAEDADDDDDYNDYEND